MSCRPAPAGRDALADFRASRTMGLHGESRDRKRFVLTRVPGQATLIGQLAGRQWVVDYPAG